MNDDMRKPGPGRPASRLARWGAALGLLAAGWSMAAAAGAASFPDHQIELVVPFSPGGSTDAMARYAAPRLSKLLGVPVVVMNKPGAGGAIGTSYVLAQPDGYRIMTGGNSNLGPLLVPGSNLARYKLDDIAPLGMSTTNTMAIVCNTGRYRDFAAFAGDIRDKPAGTVRIASWGPRSPSHFYIEILAQQIGRKVLHIPFAGGNDAMLATMGDHVDAAVVTLATALPHVQAGKLKVLAVTSAERSADLPDVPSIKELGYPKAVYVSFDGFATAAAAPPDRIARLRAAMETVLTDREYQAEIKKMGADPRFMNGTDYAAFLRRNLQTLSEIAASADMEQ
ncbi:tripartite tricarboxylate transporter substrate binding protein [Achromobacter aloeverae]